MTTPSPAQQIASDISDLQSRIGDPQDKVRLNDARDAVEDLQTTLDGMPQRIASLRTKGYVFGRDLESQAQSYAKSWAQLQPGLLTQLNTQSAALTGALRPLELQLPQLTAASANPAIARSLVNSMQSSAKVLEDKASAAEDTLRGMYDELSGKISELIHRLDDVDYLLKHLSEASFQLLPTEGGVAAVKAVWCKTGKEQKDDPEGVLYLTDQRLIFERKEDVVTKKVLFVSTEKQKVQSLQLECPVALVDKVVTSKAGMLKTEDHIDVRFLSGAPAESAHFHIWQSNAAWQALINRAKAKDFDAERAVPIDKEALAKIKSAPSQCPSCGGNLTAVVLRGQDSITCEFCGFVIRL